MTTAGLELSGQAGGGFTAVGEPEREPSCVQGACVQVMVKAPRSAELLLWRAATCTGLLK